MQEYFFCIKCEKIKNKTEKKVKVSYGGGNRLNGTGIEAKLLCM